jgi:hypothetical protein
MMNTTSAMIARITRIVHKMPIAGQPSSRSTSIVGLSPDGRMSGCAVSGSCGDVSGSGASSWDGSLLGRSERGSVVM